MRILFWGDTDGNNGPFNINKGIVSNLTEAFLTVKRRGKYRDFIAACWNLLRADVLVVSNVSRKGSVLGTAAKFLGKPLVFIMHGCNRYEAELNQAIYPDNRLAWEASLLKNADLLLPVSKKFMHWVHGYYPQYVGKTEYLFNGIDPQIFKHSPALEKNVGSILAVGGRRKEKNNMPLAEAVERLNGKAILTIYGSKKASAYERKNVIHKGQVPNEAFIQALSEASLFVLNSIFEPFSISVVEALACGCSILVSEVAGVTDLLALEETDIIHDPMDVEEIRRKMEYLLEHPNNERLRSSFDIREWSFENMVLQLEEKCKKLLKS